jgi:hypothetical protein
MERELRMGEDEEHLHMSAQQCVFLQLHTLATHSVLQQRERGPSKHCLLPHGRGAVLEPTNAAAKLTTSCWLEHGARWLASLMVFVLVAFVNAFRRPSTAADPWVEGSVLQGGMTFAIAMSMITYAIGCLVMRRSSIWQPWLAGLMVIGGILLKFIGVSGLFDVVAVFAPVFGAIIAGIYVGSTARGKQQ